MRRLRVEADGGSRGNPGPAGYGALVRDADTGELLAEVAEPVGVATNNVAEYRGLIAGLAAAARIDPDAQVEARLDSKLVVEQMSGRWRIKHADLVPLAAEARRVASGLGAVRYTWIPRNRNTHADRLANAAMDGAARGETTGPGSVPAVPSPVQPALPTEPEPAPRATPDGEAARPAGKPARAETTVTTRSTSATSGNAATPGTTDLAREDAATGWMPVDTRPTRFILLRHGETELSVERRFAGTRDIPLTDAGHEQARAAARRLADRDVDAVVSSPLSRARDTAAHVAAENGREVEVVDGFVETDFGEWEGLTFGEVGAKWPEELRRWLADTDVAPPHGESFAAVARRVAAARDDLLRRNTGRTVVVVSHVTPIKILVQQALLAPASALYRMHLDVACLTEIHYYGDGPSVVRTLNDTAHLPRVPRE